MAKKFIKEASWPQLVAAAFLFCITVLALAAPLLPLADPNAADLQSISLPPAWVDGGNPIHWLGTDAVGRDVLSRLVYGARTSIGIGVSVTAMAAVIGVLLGILGGYFGGWTDTVVSFLITARLSMPVILICLASVALFGASFTVVVTVLGTLLWDRFALVTRAMVRQLRQTDYVTAAYLLGASTPRILATEILPGIAPQLIIVATLEIGLAIVLESALSFLGMGVPPPTASWGLMISEGRNDLLFNPWLVAIPSLALFLFVTAINVFGDSLQKEALREMK
ncbi:ABC transporter permease [Caenimonas soli]|uniref:ABC transporter permease n=1 Tax=Caenimonas soli TaxID=2735555 RepID=UPI001557E2D9|nr:ABC transporter permease [Caenimonas soli]NPC55348.1 ABC transporter permease [Caenimonas soli]